jgi:ammonia channel protein AmtB
MHQPGYADDARSGVFCGGLVGRKKVLALMIQSIVSIGWTTVIWYLYGYSLCFSGDWHGIIGNFDNAFLRGIDLSTASPNDTIPAFVFVAYQMMFAIITPALISGGVHQSSNLQGLHAVPHRLADFCLFPLRPYGLGRRHVAEMGRARGSP